MRLLLWPGVLTAEYLAGRRQPYLTPIKIYFVCAAIFFLAAPWAGFNLGSLIEHDPSGTLLTRVSAQMAVRGLDRPQFEARFDLLLRSIYTISGVSASVLGLALVLQGLYRRRPFGAHVIWPLHVDSFQYLVTILAGATRQFGTSDGVASTIVLTLIGPYLVLALKRVSGGTPVAIAVKAGALVIATLATNYLTDQLAIWVTLLLV